MLYLYEYDNSLSKYYCDNNLYGYLLDYLYYNNKSEVLLPLFQCIYYLLFIIIYIVLIQSFNSPSLNMIEFYENEFMKVNKKNDLVLRSYPTIIVDIMINEEIKIQLIRNLASQFLLLLSCRSNKINRIIEKEVTQYQILKKRI